MFGASLPFDDHWLFCPGLLYSDGLLFRSELLFYAWREMMLFIGT